MLKTLVKKQMTEIFRSYFYDAKKNKARSKGTTILYIILFVLLMVGVVGGFCTFMAIGLCQPLVDAGMNWLYFTLMSLFAIFLGVFGSVFNTYSGLYLAKDNDLLLSMPIPVRYIMTARLLTVYLMGLMYSAIIIVPAVIVYWVVVPISAAIVVGGILSVLLISVFVLVLSCALGWVVAKISLKLKNKSIISVLVSLVFIGAYYFFYFKAQTLIQDLVANAAEYGSKIRSAAYPIYLIGRMGTGDWGASAICTAVVAALSALTWGLLAHSFLKIATATGANRKVKYKATNARVHRPLSALTIKELRRFAASPNYMLNCGMGILLLPAAGIAMLVKRSELIGAMTELLGQTDILASLAVAAICVISTMNDISAPSVSLEGKGIWIAQSLPIPPWTVLKAKLNAHLLLSGIPTLFCAGCAILALRPNPATAVLMLILPMLFVAWTDALGLCLNLKHPNLTWTAEVQPVKQGLGVAITLFGGWGYGILLGALPFLLQALPIALTMLIGAVVTAAFDAVMLIWIKRRGSAIFAGL